MEKVEVDGLQIAYERAGSGPVLVRRGAATHVRLAAATQP
jgi:hypothetical protein